MISKDILFLSESLTEFKGAHLTIPIFAIIVYFSFTDMQIYCLGFDLMARLCEEIN